MRTPSFLVVLVLPLAVGLLAADEPAKPAEPDPELVYAERVLKDANVTADGPGLLAFFKARTLRPADQQRLVAAVKKLGDDNFEVRERATAELVAAGRLAFAYLRPALKSTDPEVAMRAQRCIDDIERVPEGALVPAAALLIGTKRPDGATEALLDCLPWLDDESYYEPVFQALARTGLKDGAASAALRDAAKDKQPLRRAAAASALGRGDADARKAAAALLADDDVRVRFYAATSLVRGGDKAAVPPLVALLLDAPPPLVWNAEDLLARLGGDKGPTVSVGGGTDEERKKAREAWAAWWKDNGDKIDLAKVNLDDPPQQLSLIIESDGKVWECGPDKKPRWQFTVQGGQPLDARALPGGRVLVAEHSGGQVSERDLKGEVLWKHRVQNPVSCQRLPNGNTFIATYQSLMEVTRDGKVLYTHQANYGQIYHAEKLRNGGFVYAASGDTVVELDATGKEVRHVSTKAAGTTTGWGSAERLPNGNYLVALYATGKVVELDAAGKVQWECQAPSPGHATRLRNGNTLVACIEGRAVVEYDRAGKKVWSVEGIGRPFHAWRR
jgi:HEAT repeat protein